MVDFFDYVKIEGASNASDAEVDMTNADEGVRYNRVEEETERASSADERGEIAQGFDYDDTKNVSFEFSISEKEICDNVKLSFLLKLKIAASINVYYDNKALKKDYLEMSFKIEPSVGVEFSITGKAEKSFLKLGEIAFYICPGVYLGFTPEFVVGVSGSITVSGTIKGCLGFGYNSDEGFKDLSDPFEFEPKVEIEVTIFVGINMKPHIAIVHEKIADASVSAKIGFEIKAAVDLLEGLDKDAKHDCSLCIDGDISLVIEFSAEIKLLNSEKWTYGATLWDTKLKIADFYISVPYGFGFGTCPHKYYEVTFTVADAAYEKSYSDAKVYAGLLSGLITGSFNIGLHTYQLVSDNYFVLNSGALVKNASVEGKGGARYYPEDSATWSGSTAQTDANGKAKLFFKDGAQTAIVSAPGYKSQEVEFTTHQAGKSLVVFLDKKSGSGDVTSVSLDEKSLSLTVSDTATLAATIEPSDATDKSVTWTSSDENVATVSQSGLVTAKASGTATITVTTADGGFTDTCTVTVSAAHTWAVGDIGTFGSYPQTRVTDSALLSALNAQALNWVSYGYYRGTGSEGTMTQSDYMKYADVTYGGSKYRAVKFTSYRPYWTYGTSSSNQDDNGYSTNTVYWFKYEHLKWRVLDPSTGLVMCESIIDSQAYSNTIYYQSSTGNYYNNSARTINADDYATSSMRTWLNGDFYTTAFTVTEQSAINTTALDNSASTNDKLFLLSYSEATNTAYGFSSSYSTYDTARRAQGSDYAKCQGLRVYSYSGEFYGNSFWFLRSPGDGSHYASYTSDRRGYVSGSSFGVSYTDVGVRPAFKISNLSSLIFTSSEAKSETASSVGTKTARAVLTSSGSSSGKSYVTCGGATAGERYTLIVTTGTLDNLTPSSLLFIGQQTAASITLCFGFVPRTSETANAYITGNFSGIEQKVITAVPVELSEIKIATPPTKTDYFISDTLDTTGLTLTATFNNNTTATIDSGFTCDPTLLNTAGTITITVTFGDKTCTFSVTVSKIDASGFTVTPIPNQTYTGSAIKPIVEVKFNGETLTLNTDYTLSYTNNTNVGTATVTIMGKGNFTGTKTEPFNILTANASDFTVTPIPDQAYTGSEITPTVDVKINGETLTLNTDYTVTYTSNINVGTATVTITGKGNFSDETTVTFKIVSSHVAVTGITLSSTALSLQYKGTSKLTVTFSPANATNKNVTWKSNNEKVAIVDANGNVTAKGRGTATITATTEDGGKMASCTVTVKLAWWQWLIKIILFGWIWY